jgi:cyclic pyranopterin phosphate synthase
MAIDTMKTVSRAGPALIDGFGRRISYVRLSVTDRCDLRCRYCMSERMTFLPKRDILTFEELAALADIFIARGVNRIRLTGGEPLVRRGVEDLIAALGERLGRGLNELTLTTNGTQLDRFAPLLAAAGVRRVNVSLDSLDPARFRHITRRGDLDQVLSGIAAAQRAGLRVKINMVALRGLNEGEIAGMLGWCIEHDHDLSLIETMPLGQVDDDRTEHYLPLDEVKRALDSIFDLRPTVVRTGGPARYWEVGGTGVRLGMITPLTENFCSGCNRVRVAATGTIYGCLGHDQKVELRDLLRRGGREAVDEALDQLIAAKPRRHDFLIAAQQPAVGRHMSVTGG